MVWNLLICWLAVGVFGWVLWVVCDCIKDGQR